MDRQDRWQGAAKHLHRQRKGARFAGVCAGIAAYFGVDPFLIRIAWVASFFVFGPLAFLAYLGMIALLPTEDEATAADRSFQRTIESRVTSAFGDFCVRARNRKARNKGRRRAQAFQSTAAAPETLSATRDRVVAMEKRVVAMETYIASREFDLSRKIDDLEK